MIEPIFWVIAIPSFAFFGWMVWAAWSSRHLTKGGRETHPERRTSVGRDW